MEALGARVVARQADVSRREDVSRLIAEMASDGPPLRGVIHAAGVLDDGAVLGTTWPRMVPVLAAKAGGAWHLDRATRDLPLDFFVMYSSVASVFGSPGQAGYAAANAFLDGLAHRRTAEGRPGLSVNWGPWAEVGMAASQDEAIQRRRAEGGAEAISPADGLRVLGGLFERRTTQAVVFPVRWGAFLRGREAPPFLRDVAREAASPKRGGAEHGPALLRQIAEAPESERADVLLAHVRQQALKVLGLAATHPLNPDQPLSDLGLDSLMAVELRNALGAALGATLPPTLLFDYPTVNAVASLLAQKIPTMSKEPVAQPARDERERDALVAEIQELSESEVEAAIARELGTLGK
jgi:acyl carrier protein